jgi:tetratricopeptide repeat protein
MTTAEWEQQVAEAWASIDERDETEFLTLMEKLVEELPPGDPAGLFERAASLDSTGHSDLAVPLYARALEAGVSGERRRRSVIQMASSLRNLGRSAESIELLTAELATGSDHLDDAAKCVLAMALTDVGRAREGVSILVGAIAPRLPRYQRSMANYARLLIEPDPDAAEPETVVRS